MKRLLCIISAMALSACMGGSGMTTSAAVVAPVVPPPSAPIVAPAPTPTTFEGMLNQVRADNGSAPLSYDARLGRAAQVHADDMLSMGRMTHTGSDGSNAGQRISREGYNWRTWGENVARGYQTEEAVLEGWVNSPGHQANNINPAFEDFGLAKAGSGSQLYWALVFGAER